MWQLSGKFATWGGLWDDIGFVATSEPFEIGWLAIGMTSAVGSISSPQIPMNQRIFTMRISLIMISCMYVAFHAQRRPD